MKAFICNSTVLGIAGYGPGLASLMLYSSFIPSPTESKTTAQLEIKFNILFISGTNFSGSSVSYARELNLSEQW